MVVVVPKSGWGSGPSLGGGRVPQPSCVSLYPGPERFPRPPGAPRRPRPARRARPLWDEQLRRPRPRRPSWSAWAGRGPRASWRPGKACLLPLPALDPLRAWPGVGGEHQSPPIPPLPRSSQGGGSWLWAPGEEEPEWPTHWVTPAAPFSSGPPAGQWTSQSLSPGVGPACRPGGREEPASGTHHSWGAQSPATPLPTPGGPRGLEVPTRVAIRVAPREPGARNVFAGRRAPEAQSARSWRRPVDGARLCSSDQPLTHGLGALLILPYSINSTKREQT